MGALVCSERLRAQGAASQSRSSPSASGRNAVTRWAYVRARMSAKALSVTAHPSFSRPSLRHGASPASAAELFASSLRTLNGARLVGTTTQGKGTIQSSPQRLSDGSAVSITVAKLLCGDGTSFDGTGLTVDVERPLTADEQTAYYDYTVENDPQIQRAVSTAQQMSGTTTVSGVNEAASSEAADRAAALHGETGMLPHDLLDALGTLFAENGR